MREFPLPQYKYVELGYASGLETAECVPIAIVAFSTHRPAIVSGRLRSSLSRIPGLSGAADILIVEQAVRAFVEHVKENPSYVEIAMGWENSIRVSPPQSLVSSDTEGKLDAIACAILGERGVPL
jgi:hypothetical protein